MTDTPTVFREARKRADAAAPENVALVERFFEALGKLDFDAAAELVACPTQIVSKSGATCCIAS